MRKTSISILTAVSLVGTFASAGPTFAAGCREYAEQAVISASQNRQWGCGFGGRRWSFNYEEHLDWCRSVGYDQALGERLTRQRMLHACHG